MPGDREEFLVCRRDGGAPAGVVTIDSIIRGRFQSASVTYVASAAAAGHGYMSEALPWCSSTRSASCGCTGSRPISSRPT